MLENSATKVSLSATNWSDTVREICRLLSLSVCIKETTLERADFTLQLLIFITAEKERELFIIFFLSSFCQLLSPLFEARTAQTNRPRMQLFLM